VSGGLSRAPALPLAPLPGVLIVDDVQANLVALQGLLEEMGCEVVLARSGNEALRQLLKREFAVMLLDVQMPEMDGYEVAAYARQNPATREVPIIFLTATHNDERNVLRGYGSGAVDFLFKPISAPILRSKVRVFLELYAGRRQTIDAMERLERAYRELQATQAHLIQSAKMASLGTLVAGVAHEINNPLSFALSHLDTVQRSLAFLHGEMEPALSDAGRDHWSRARSRLTEMGGGLERIRDLVLKLRTFSRLDEGERKVASIREAVESVLTILDHRLKDRILVQCNFGEPERIECFPGPLNQALMNLISNAIDAVEDNGTIAISTGLDGDGFVISIVDSGAGIPSAIRDRVLEPFFTTKPVGHGTGLGLSITYSIVQRHGGTLELSDAEGGGTKAVVRLPLERERAGDTSGVP
jgi:two-component system NtrC family sensor kinase